MELSFIDIRYVVAKVSGLLQGYYLNNIYEVKEGTILLRFHRSLEEERHLMLAAGRGLWMTKYRHEQAGQGSLVKRLRAELARAKFLAISQPRVERIVFIDFEGEGGQRRLVGEFFGEGNLLLLDRQGTILSLLRHLRVRHRELKTGSSYSLPPSRGRDPLTIEVEDLLPLLSSDLEVPRWMGRDLSLSRMYIEETVRRAEVPLSRKGSELARQDIERLALELRRLVNSLEDGTPVIIKKDGRAWGAAPFPVTDQGGLEVVGAPSYMEAIDEVMTEELVHATQVDRLGPFNQKLEELEKSLEEQRQVWRATLERSVLLRRAAQRISEDLATMGTIGTELASQALGDLGIKGVVQKDGQVVITFADFDVTGKAQSPQGVASVLYDEAKALELKADAIRKAEAKLQLQKERLKEGLQKAPSEEEAKPQQIRRRSWFEGFRWFLTSEGLLALGGKDATTNNMLLRRHVSEGDLLFHAEIVGSPLFLLKDASKGGDTSILEVAKAVVSFSRAWREGFSVADAYWVRPEQVKLQGPSGLYLPKGAFLIEGKKNMLANLGLEVSVGVALSEGGFVITSGPPSAIRAHCRAFVTLKPSKRKASDTAKAVKADLFQLLDGELRQAIKSLPLDDVLRVLPPGGGERVERGRGSAVD